MSFNLACSDSNNVLSLTRAILVYSSGSNAVYASVHDVDSSQDQPRIKAGVGVTKDALQSMFKTLLPEMYSKPVLLAENVLASGSNYMVWYTKPQKRVLWFDCKELGGKVSGSVPLPGLVFFVLGDKWYVFSYKGSKRPTADTMLYDSPFLNVWSGGRICEGNAKRPQVMSISEIEKWEDVFFRSRFTHSNNQSNFIKYEGGAFSFWRDLLGNRWDKFPDKTLVKTGKTLSQTFDMLFTGDKK